MKWFKRWWLNRRLDSLREDQTMCAWAMVGTTSDEFREKMAGFSRSISADIERVQKQLKALD